MSQRTKPLGMAPKERARLEGWVKSETTPQRLVFRSKICLLAAQGIPNTQVAERLNTSRPTVRLWKQRFLEGGPDGLVHDAPRGPGPRRLDETLREAIINAVTNPLAPKETRWTTRTLAKALGISNATVSRVWRSYGITGSKKKKTVNTGVSVHSSRQGSEIVGIYAAPSVLVVAARNEPRGTDADGVMGPLGRLVSDDLPESTEIGKYRDYRPRFRGAIDIIEKITFNTHESEMDHLHLLEFLESLGKGFAKDSRILLLLFDPPQGVQSIVEDFATRRPWMAVRILPHVPVSGEVKEKSFYEQVQDLQLSMEPRALRDFLNAINLLIQKGTLSKEPLVWSNLCPTSQENNIAKVASETIRGFGRFLTDILKLDSGAMKFVYWNGGNAVNWRQKLESLFAAAAFAEAGEHDTAREICRTRIPDVREPLGIVSGFSAAFVAAAFAEENCHDMAAGLLADAAPQRSFLEEVGLIGVRVHYGLVSAERSFADAVGLTGARYRILTLQL